MLAPNLFQVRIILETARTTQAINADARCFSADDSVDGSGSGAELAPDDLGCSGTRISSTTSMTRGVCVVVLVTIGGLVVVSTVAGAVDDASVRALVAVSVVGLVVEAAASGAGNAVVVVAVKVSSARVSVC